MRLNECERTATIRPDASRNPHAARPDRAGPAGRAAPAKRSHGGPATIPLSPGLAGVKTTTTVKGRGAASNPASRYLETETEPFDDGWGRDEEATPRPATTVIADASRSVIARNDSPDVPFDQSVNPYRGCEHGCIYCYARPSHAWLDLSPGLDFETRLFAKPDAARLLKRELARSGYRCRPIALGTNTDPYQPIERRWRITRAIVEVLHDCDHPLLITTKSSMVERDLDLLSAMAKKRLVKVAISVTTLDRTLARRMEPRATAPQRRLQSLEALAAAGVPTGVMFAPVIPALNDGELERVLQQAARRGVRYAGYVMLRLPHEVRRLFEEWLHVHYPDRAARVLEQVRDVRGGRENDPRFGHRMRGSGVFAELIRQRFLSQCRRLGLNDTRPHLDTAAFRPPALGRQLSLF